MANELDMSFYQKIHMVEILQTFANNHSKNLSICHDDYDNGKLHIEFMWSDACSLDKSILTDREKVLFDSFCSYFNEYTDYLPSNNFDLIEMPAWKALANEARLLLDATGWNEWLYNIRNSA